MMIWSFQIATWVGRAALVLLVCFATAQSALAEANLPPSTLSLLDRSEALAGHVRIQQDVDNKLNAQEIWRQADQFTPTGQKQIHLENDAGSYWLWLPLFNPTSSAKLRILDLDYSLLITAELYRVVEGKPELADKIDLHASAFERKIVHRNPAFQIQIAPQQHVDYLIKLQFASKANYELELKPYLYTTGEFILHQSIEHILFAGFLGSLLSIVIYNMILFTRVKISGHVYYSLYLSCYIFIVLFYEGFIFYLPHPPPVSWVIAGMTLTPIYASISLIAFGRSILRLVQFTPRLDKLYKLISISLLLLSPVTFAHIGWLNLAFELTGVITTLSLGIVAALLHRKGIAAKYFAISFIFIAVGYAIEISLYSISAMSWFNSATMNLALGIITQYFFYTCAAIEMIFLAFALASYINQMRDDKEYAQAESLVQKEETNRLQSNYAIKLENEIAERTQEVTEQSLKLTEQNKSLKEMDKLKSVFFANISHEFRTPLTLIRGPFQQMLNGSYGKLCPQLQEAASTGSRNSDRLNRLIEELLMLSKLESGNLNLRVSEHDIRLFCRRIASLFMHTAKEKNISFDLQLPDETVLLYFDGEKLETILCNLLSNAFKYTQVDGSVTLIINPPNEIDERGADSFVTITVKDDGPGVPDQLHKQIFERFYRVNAANEEALPGSGIGLALVKELVELHSGSIGLNSHVKQGCEFLLKLPVGKAHFSDVELTNRKQLIDSPDITHQVYPVQPPSSDGGTGDTQENTPILLLVEDITEMRSFIASLLRPAYTVIEAHNGREALDIIQQQAVDIIVSDIMMPKMDGLSMLEHLRQQDAFRHIPVLLLTARAADEDRIMALRARADDYLAKPFDTEELQLRIRNLLERSKAQISQVASATSMTTESVALDSADQAFIKKARQLILDNLKQTDFGVNQLAKALFVSKNTLHRRLESAGVETPATFMRNIRLQQAHHLAQQNAYRTKAEIAYAVGFSSAGYFSSVYQQYLNEIEKH